MAKITFLGGEDTGNVGSVKWGRYTFALNLPVDCNDPHIVAKASGNRFFSVSGSGGKIEAEIVPDDPADDPPEPETPVQALDVPEATEEPPVPAPRRGRPPKAKAA